MQKIAFAAAIVVALLFSAGASADRPFPEKARRGEMKAFEYPLMKIGDVVYRMSPASRIFNQQNLIIMPASLQVQNAQIAYTLDTQGGLYQVWLLTPEEAARYPMPAKPVPPGNQ